MTVAASAPRSRWGLLALNAVFSIGLIVSISIWYAFMSEAVTGTAAIAATLSMPPPPAAAAAPAALAATLAAALAVAAGCVAAPAAAAARGARGGTAAAAPSRRAAGAAAAAGAALLAVWLVAASAVTLLWAGSALVTANSTGDAAVTLRSVDPALKLMIYQATGGSVNPRKDGFMLSIASATPGAPARQANIGMSACNLLCPFFSRAMLAQPSDCLCDEGVMRRVQAQAGAMAARSLVPAAACGFAALLCAGGLLAAACAALGGGGGGAAAAAAAEPAAPGTPSSEGGCPVKAELRVLSGAGKDSFFSTRDQDSAV
ncbi:hypothetical protein Rsub_09243 [Raphidocelis subcapitata]|uniref:Uncharacterized protein n=1 Tax=Raphidocelis subcapitata TaxID=307507 RepID=A0A2V0P9B0_9CHLO|nr:hypothetical protein Rsub_09243 [Raphidocelis subcapitata]|eukprot:GBF96444.1 hypothetical protein Rsub_09243 [Raphidocelis subcapitata]